MTSCSITAQKLGTLICPGWGSKTMKKNRIVLTKQKIPLILNSKYVYLYIRTKNAVHECIITICPDDTGIIQDSYVDYRHVESRKYNNFSMKLYELCNNNPKIYKILFNSPRDIELKNVNAYFNVLK